MIGSDLEPGPSSLASPKPKSGLTVLLQESSLIPTLIMLGVLAIAALLRFVQLSQRGLIYWDEAKFALEGERMHAYIQSYFGSNVPLTIGKTVGTAKPTHALLIGLAYFIFGIHDYVPMFMDAFASLVSIGLAYVIGRRLFGPWAAVIGALFLAVSEYDVIYARSALSESDANALFLAAFLCWVIDWDRVAAVLPNARAFPSRLLVIGAVLAGASFTANYRLVVYIVALVGFDLVWTWKESGWRPAFRRLIPWIGGLAAVPVAWQILDIIARVNGHVLFRSEVNVLVKSGGTVLFKNVSEGGPEWYLVQALFQLHGGKQSIIHFNPLIYLQWFVLREGWGIALLVLIGLYFALRTRVFPWLALATVVVIPYLIYTFAPFIVPRNLDAALPFACLLAAAALVTLAERLPRDLLRRSALIVAGCIIAGFAASQSWHLRHEHSGFALAANYVKHRGGRALTANEIMVFYLPGSPSGTRCDAPPVPYSLRKLSADRHAGYSYAVLDQQSTPAQRYISSHGRLVASYPAFGALNIGENPISTENGNAPNTGMHEMVNVYDISGLHLPRPTATPDKCYRNVPT